MADNFSTSIRELQNMPEIQEPIQYEGTNNRLSMDTEIHQAMNMANKINKKLEDYKENMTEYEQYGNASMPEEVQKEEWYIKIFNSLKDLSNKNDLFVIFVLIVIFFSMQLTEVINTYLPIVPNQNELLVVATKALVITIIYHVIKKLLL